MNDAKETVVSHLLEIDNSDCYYLAANMSYLESCKRHGYDEWVGYDLSNHLGFVVFPHQLPHSTTRIIMGIDEAIEVTEGAIRINTL